MKIVQILFTKWMGFNLFKNKVVDLLFLAIYQIQPLTNQLTLSWIEVSLKFVISMSWLLSNNSLAPYMGLGLVCPKFLQAAEFELS